MTKHSYDKEFKEQAVQYYLDNKDHMTMNEIRKQLQLEDVEDGELVNTDSDDQQTGPRIKSVQVK